MTVFNTLIIPLIDNKPYYLFAVQDNKFFLKKCHSVLFTLLSIKNISTREIL